jgi:hypothetical protein
MKKRPLLVRLLAYALWLAPVGMTIELVYIYRVPLHQWYYIFNPEIWNWQVILASVISPLVGFAVWTVHRWGYFALVAYAVLLLINNLAIWAFDLALSPIGLRIALLAGIILLVVILMRRQFMVPYFNPRLRWWEQARRYHTGTFHVALKEFKTGTILFEADSFDVSVTGCFIASDHEVRIGEVFGFNIGIPGGTVFHATGEVVWVHGGNDETPRGFGCRFLTVEPHFREGMDKAIKQLHLHVRQNR